MRKNLIKEEVRKEILTILNEFGINLDIINIATKMDLDIVELFYEKIFTNNSPGNILVVVRNLLGVYGNYYATKYFTNKGYVIINELPVRNKLGITVTKADLAFIDNEGRLNLCEVKATTQIIDNIRNYVDPNKNENIGYYEDKDEEILKYKYIGKKLIKQALKLSKGGAVVNIIVFEGCYIDGIIKKQLEQLGAKISVLSPNINALENDIKVAVNEISKHRLNCAFESSDFINHKSKR